MSNRLAISASLSVLMMSAFALFSAHSAHAPIGPATPSSAVQINAPSLSIEPSRLLTLGH